MDKVNEGAPEDDLPRLICVSGRLELAVSKILDDVESRPVDAEYVRLLQGVFGDDISGHVFRGYTILSESRIANVRRKKSFSIHPGRFCPFDM